MRRFRRKPPRPDARRTPAALAGILVAFAVPAALAACATGASGPGQCGVASWYEYTTITANGERANPNALTAAHRSLPFDTRVVVTNLDNGRRVLVRINDRGPFIDGRVIDLMRAAAHRIDMVDAGLANVRVTIYRGDKNALPGPYC